MWKGLGAKAVDLDVIHGKNISVEKNRTHTLNTVDVFREHKKDKNKQRMIVTANRQERKSRKPKSMHLYKRRSRNVQMSQVKL